MTALQADTLYPVDGTTTSSVGGSSSHLTLARRHLKHQKSPVKTKCQRHSKTSYCRTLRSKLPRSAAKSNSTSAVQGNNTSTSETTSASPTSSENNSAVNNISTGTFTGDATYYGTGLGACGITNADTQMIAAVSMTLFDNFPGATANSNLNPICGRKVKATYKGASVVVEIVDRCVGCAVHDLDFSPSAFALIGPVAEGRLSGMTWEWV